MQYSIIQCNGWMAMPNKLNRTESRIDTVYLHMQLSPLKTLWVLVEAQAKKVGTCNANVFTGVPSGDKGDGNCEGSFGNNFDPWMRLNDTQCIFPVDPLFQEGTHKFVY